MINWPQHPPEYQKNGVFSGRLYFSLDARLSCFVVLSRYHYTPSFSRGFLDVI